jgi:predicted nucleotidyltransferase
MPPPIHISESDWQEVQRVLVQEIPGLEVWAFGSRARGDAKLYSDLDLAIITTTPLSLSQLASLTHAFESSDMTIRVDVVDWSSISEAFRRIVSSNKVVIQPPATSTQC